MAEKLALLGGKAVRTKSFPIWPRASVLGKKYLNLVVKSNGWGIFRGSRIKEFGQKFAAYHGAKYGIPCVNATVALEIQLKALGVRPGDEVITTVFSCLPTISGILAIGAIPVFVDINERNSIDPNLVEAKITNRTKVIMPVHLYDSLCDLDAFRRIARKYKLHLIEDAAQMPGSFWRGKGVGTIGISGSFSFQEAKIMTAGEGGIVITNNRELSEIMHAYINCGRVTIGDRTKRRVLGGNYRMNEFQAALLLAQLENLKKNTDLRIRNAQRLNDGINGLPGIRTNLPLPQSTRQAYYFYTFRFIEEEVGISRETFIKALNAEGVPTKNTFVPLYRDPLFNMNEYDAPLAWRYFKKHKLSAKDFPVAEKVSREIVGLWHPLLAGNNSDIDDIVAAIKKVIGSAHLLKGRNKLI